MFPSVGHNTYIKPCDGKNEQQKIERRSREDDYNTLAQLNGLAQRRICNWLYLTLHML